MNKGFIEKNFPNLLTNGYEITSPATVEYNCIAWAAEDIEKYWWPDASRDYYWPHEIERNETLDAFTKAYELLGYKVCNNATHEAGYEKIAIFVKDNKPTHAARQLNSGHWTSKLGQCEDIEHFALDGVENEIYGSAAVFLKRPRKNFCENS